MPEKVEDLPSLLPRDLALRIRGQFWDSNQMQIPPTITPLRLRTVTDPRRLSWTDAGWDPTLRVPIARGPPGLPRSDKAAFTLPTLKTGRAPLSLNRLLLRPP